MVRVAEYPQMRACAWYLAEDTVFTDQEALAFYERNWRHIDESQLDAREKARLAAEVGHGFLNV